MRCQKQYKGNDKEREKKERTNSWSDNEEEGGNGQEKSNASFTRQINQAEHEKKMRKAWKYEQGEGD